jgi:hypothetical protein
MTVDRRELGRWEKAIVLSRARFIPLARYCPLTIFTPGIAGKHI